MDSILTTIKKMLGIDSDDTNFDTDIIININSAIMVLDQLGVGVSTGFIVTDSSETWGDLLDDELNLEAVKTYIYLKVRLVFDPPTVNAVLDSMDRQITQLEWRLNVQVEKDTTGVI